MAGDTICPMCGRKLGDHTVDQLAECQGRKN